MYRGGAKEGEGTYLEELSTWPSQLLDGYVSEGMRGQLWGTHRTRRRFDAIRLRGGSER